ncbi:MAG TPA: alcohol dehydrogenase catalytic domain-containing protein [Methylomirabilota bacterium]|nr:alcohol dehydrogenase catalytic domain-containing protein [Methylomirabilota bacterium]
MATSRIMKAAVLHGADDLRICDWPVPEPGPGEVLLRVAVASICGTDAKVLHRQLAGQPPGPFVMGHEYAGTVAAVGPGADEFRVGERVAVEVHKGCGRCPNCIRGWYTACLNYGDLSKGHRAKGLTCDGGFAEFAANHVNTLHRLPEGVTFEQAVMVTTAGSPLWTIDLMGGDMAGETVLVLGPGPIGLMAVQLAKALGAERVILAGTRDWRLEVGRRLGADVTVNVRREPLGPRVRAITDGLGADTVLECAGGPGTLQDALENVRRGGRIGLTAFYAGPVQADLNLAVLNQVRLYPSRGEGGRSCARALALMGSGRLQADPLVTHRFTLERIHEAFDAATGHKDETLKVAIHI